MNGTTSINLCPQKICVQCVHTYLHTHLHIYMSTHEYDTHTIHTQIRQSDIGRHFILLTGLHTNMDTHEHMHVHTHTQNYQPCDKVQQILANLLIVCQHIIWDRINWASESLYSKPNVGTTIKNSQININIFILPLAKLILKDI